MPKQPTHGERLAVIEQILTEMRDNKTSHDATLRDIRDDIKAFRKDFDDHKQDYHALKNKGIGIAATLSMLFAGLGFAAHMLKDKIVGVFS